MLHVSPVQRAKTNTNCKSKTPVALKSENYARVWGKIHMPLNIENLLNSSMFQIFKTDLDQSCNNLFTNHDVRLNGASQLQHI